MSVRRWEFESREYRELMEHDRVWECPLCGEVRFGESAPSECPVCMAPGYAFKEARAGAPMPVPDALPDTAPTHAHADERKDEKQWRRSTKSLRLSVHPKPA